MELGQQILLAASRGQKTPAVQGPGATATRLFQKHIELEKPGVEWVFSTNLDQPKDKEATLPPFPTMVHCTPGARLETLALVEDGSG